jgi:hypothetical protein
MPIYMSEKPFESMTRRHQKVLRELGFYLKYTQCLNLAVRLFGFDDHQDFLARDLDAPLSALDDELSDEEFAARDDHQMGVLAAAGLGPVAREFLDRANPTGSCRGRRWMSRSGTQSPATTRSD